MPRSATSVERPGALGKVCNGFGKFDPPTASCLLTGRQWRPKVYERRRPEDGSSNAQLAPDRFVLATAGSEGDLVPDVVLEPSTRVEALRPPASGAQPPHSTIGAGSRLPVPGLGRGWVQRALVGLDAVAVAYLLAGTYRYDPRLALPSGWSLNQALGLLLGIGLVVEMGRVWRSPDDRRAALRARATLGSVLVLAAVLLLRLPGSANLSYGSFKLLSYDLLVIPVLLHVEMRVRTAGDLRRFLWIFVLAAAVLVAVAVPHALELEGGERLAALGGGPNVFARLLGAGILAAWALATHAGARSVRFLLRAWIPFAALAMVLTGSKAALLSLAIAFAVLLHRSGQRRAARALFAALVLAALVPLVAHPFVRDLPKDGALVRLLRLPDVEDSFGSYGARLRYLHGSWEQFREQPWLGVGTGAWGTRLGLGMERWYPHNLPIEVATELGILGLVLVAVPLVALPRPLLAGAGPLAAALAALALFWGLNVQLSGDLVDSRYFWFFLLLLEMHARLARRVGHAAVGEPTMAAAVPATVGAKGVACESAS